MLSLAIAVSGFPVQSLAASGAKCPSGMNMQMKKDCKSCPMEKKQVSKKNNCCGDKSCAKQCSVVSNASGMLTSIIVAYTATGAAPKPVMLGNVVLPRLPLMQERPPKSLA